MTAFEVNTNVSHEPMAKYEISHITLMTPTKIRQKKKRGVSGRYPITWFSINSINEIDMPNANPPRAYLICSFFGGKVSFTLYSFYF